MGRKEAIALGLSLTVLGGGVWGLALMGESTPPSPPQATTENTGTDYWAAALDAGYNAAVLAQTATSEEDWAAVAEGWNEAVGLLARVPDDHPQAAQVAAKDAEYIANRDAARARQQQAATAWLPTDGEYSIKDADSLLGTTTPVGWRWLQAQEYGCEYGDYCFGVAVVPKDGCPDNLYVELSLLDDEDNNIGFTNATTSAVSPGQTAKLTFSGYEDSTTVQSARLAKISCY